MSVSALPSVVIPVRNGAATVSATLRSLEHQIGAPDGIEILVVDNGSDDDTAEIVRAHDVTLLQEQKRGAAAARNRGIRCARGEVVLCLDADMLPTRTWLSNMLAPFTDDETVLVAGQTVCYRPETAADRYVQTAGLFDVEVNVRHPLLPCAPSGNMAVRRAAALAIGGFDESFHQAEDVDFCVRLARSLPHEIMYQPAAVAFHRFLGTDDRLREEAWRYGEGSAALYRRYPEVLPWGQRQTFRVIVGQAARTLKPEWLRLGRYVGLVESDRLEFERYHRLWTWWYWRGFAHRFRHDPRMR